MKALSHITLLLVVAAFLAACAEPPKPPSIVFNDQPSSLSPSRYRSGESTDNRVVYDSEAFRAANEEALERGIDSHNADVEARRAARKARDTVVVSSASGGTINGERCYNCGGSGTIKCPGSGYNLRDIRMCPNCHGTDRITCPSCAGKGYRIP